MARGGKINYREHYKPEPAIFGPYTRTEPSWSDIVMIWLSGMAVGVVVTLIATGY